MAFVIVVALAGCATGSETTSGPRGADDRNTRVDSPRDNSSSGSTPRDMPGNGRGGEHRPQKH